MDGLQGRVGVPRVAGRAYQLVSKYSKVATMMTVGMFPTMSFYAYVLNFSFEISFAMIVFVDVF